MAITIAKKVWASVSTILSAASLSTARDSSAVDLATDGYEGSEVDVSITWDASGTVNAKVSVAADEAGSFGGTERYLYELIAEVSAGATTKLPPMIIKDVAHFRVTVQHTASEANAATVTIKSRPWRYGFA